MKTIDYLKQGSDFIKLHKLTFAATKYPAAMQEPPNWDDQRIVRTKVGLLSHGYRYRITIGREHATDVVKFDYWGSIADREALELRAYLGELNTSERKRELEARREPTAYSVLASISGDIHCPEDFDEFCGEYGYDSDSRKAKAMHKRCAKFAKQLRAFFTTSELEALAEIS